VHADAGYTGVEKRPEMAQAEGMIRANRHRLDNASQSHRLRRQQALFRRYRANEAGRPLDAVLISVSLV
jgi:hypothetical protein